MVAEIAASSEVPGTEQLVDCQLDSAVAREFHDAFAGGGRWGAGRRISTQIKLDP